MMTTRSPLSTICSDGKYDKFMNFMAASLRIMSKNLDKKKDVKFEGKGWQKVNVNEANNNDEDKVSELMDKLDLLNDKMMKSVKAEIEDVEHNVLTKLKQRLENVTPLDCFMQVSMTLRTDQEKIAGILAQLRNDQETISTNVVQVVDKIKTRFKDLETVKANLLKANQCQDLFSGMGSKRVNCPVHQKEASKKRKKNPGGG